MYSFYQKKIVGLRFSYQWLKELIFIIIYIYDIIFMLLISLQKYLGLDWEQCVESAEIKWISIGNQGMLITLTLNYFDQALPSEFYSNSTYEGRIWFEINVFGSNSMIYHTIYYYFRLKYSRSLRIFKTVNMLLTFAIPKFALVLC